VIRKTFVLSKFQVGERTLPVRLSVDQEASEPLDDIEQTKLGVEIWKKTVDVQQHFNDIEMRIRNYALTLLVAVLGAAALAVREGTVLTLGGIETSLAVWILVAGLITWCAFGLMDGLWYHRLLVGSVKHGIALEQELKGKVPNIGLTKAIGDNSPFSFMGRKVHSSAKLAGFYSIVAVLLVVLAVVIQVAALANALPKVSDTPKKQPAKTAPSTTSDEKPSSTTNARTSNG
jgi:hypothetical protein